MLHQISVIRAACETRLGIRQQEQEGARRTPDTHSRVSVQTTHTVCPSTMLPATCNYRNAVAIRQSVCFRLEQMLQAH
jgi:hypothetical protein